MALYRELMTGGVEPEVGLKADGRRLRPAAREQRGEPVTALPEGVIVVSGGARGVTAACLLALLEHTPLPLAVLGRTALEDEPAELANIQGDAALKHALLQRSQQRGEQLSPQELGAQVRRLLARRELKANLARFEALGAKVHYQSVDITDGEAVLRALERVRAELGPIRGLIHAAGVLADKEIRAKTPEQFERVLNTKVEGLLNLLQATADDALTHIACFSSVAARRGNIGQVDYAMANEVLNRVCQQERARRGPGCLVKSIGWGPWAGGMVDAALEKYFRAQGVGLIPLADGARLFVEEFTGAHGGAVELVVGKGLEHFGAARISVREQPTFDLRFHRSTHPYLASHVTRDLPVVPMVTVNDLALQAARALLPDTRLMATANLEVIKGITLPRFEGEGDRFLLECRREAEAVKIRLVGLDGSLHYRLEVPLADEMPAAMPEVPEPPLQAWKPESGRIYDGRLFHGPALQVITALEGIGEQGCAGALQSTMADPSGSFLPLDLQDGGLQLVTLWNHEYAGCESLPTAIAEFCSYKPWSGGPVHCLAVLAAPGDLKQQWHLYFRDANGDLLAAMRGLCVHLLPHAKSRSTADPALLSDPV